MRFVLRVGRRFSGSIGDERRRENDEPTLGGPVMADVVWDQGPSGFTVCDECEDGWVYPAPHGVDATDCPAFYDICRCEGTPCPSCRGSGLVATDELREKA